MAYKHGFVIEYVLPPWKKDKHSKKKKRKKAVRKSPAMRSANNKQSARGMLVAKEPVVEVSWLTVGKLICHKVFGQGKVVSNNGRHICVQFDQSAQGMKTLLIQSCLENVLIQPAE